MLPACPRKLMIRGQQNTQVKCLEHNPDLRSAYKTHVIIEGENQHSEVVVRPSLCTLACIPTHTHRHTVIIF